VLIEAALRFPTVIFTIGLGIVLIYWLFVLLGALDIDLFGHHDIGGGGHDIGDVGGGGHDIGGHDVGDAGGHGGDGADGHDVDGDGHGGGWFGALGLAKVPITISLSVIFLVCWLLALLMMAWGPELFGDASWLAPVVLPLTLIIGLPIAGLIVRPLGRVFETKGGRTNKDCIGQICTITTGSVTDKFGQATVEDGGTMLIIQVRCDRSDVLGRDAKALIIDFDSEREAFIVEPVADMLPASDKQGKE
jgi:hypothetical protein